MPIGFLDFLRHDPQSGWQWVRLFAGMVAFPLSVLGVLTVPSLIWGGPRITVRFDAPNDKLRGLSCNIQNVPVSGRWARRLIRRASVDVVPSLLIQQEPTNQSVVQGIPELHMYDGTHSQRVTLPPSLIASCFFPVIVRDSRGVFVPLYRDDETDPIVLRPGGYRAIILLELAGDTESYIKRFVVTETTEYWA